MAIPTANRPKGRSIRNLRMVWGFALDYPGHIAVAALALLVAAGGDVGRALRVQADHRQRLRARARARTRDIARWFEYLLLLVGVMALATAVRFYFVSWLGERTVADIRLAVHRNLLRLSPGFFEENRPAEITSRITVDTTIIEQVVGTTVSVALRNLVMGIGVHRHPVRARAQARRADAARHLRSSSSRSSSSAAACARSRRAARTASPTSAPSPAKCSAR